MVPFYHERHVKGHEKTCGTIELLIIYFPGAITD